MSEKLVSLLFLLIILIPLVVFARQIQQVRRGTHRKLKAALLFFAYSILPALTYVLVFLVLAGIEEVMKLPAISEGMARSLLPVVGVGLAEVLLLTVIFAITTWLLPTARRVEDTARHR